LHREVAVQLCRDTRPCGQRWTGSYETLRRAERTALCRLAVFTTTFDTQAACALMVDEEIKATDVPERLTDLAEKSLLTVCWAGEQVLYRLRQPDDALPEEYGIGGWTAAARSLWWWFLQPRPPACYPQVRFRLLTHVADSSRRIRLGSAGSFRPQTRRLQPVHERPFIEAEMSFGAAGRGHACRECRPKR